MGDFQTGKHAGQGGRLNVFRALGGRARHLFVFDEPRYCYQPGLMGLLHSGRCGIRGFGPLSVV